METGIKKTKVLFVITKSNFGGAQRYVFDLATNLPKERFESVVALGGFGPLKEKLDLAGIQTIAMPDLERDIGFLKEARAFLNIFRTLKTTRPDIVHLNSSKAGALGALATRLYNLPHTLYATRYTLHAKIIFTVHGWAFKEKRKKLSRKIIEYVSWLTVFLSDRVIVVSEDDREKARRFLFVQQKITVIHNGINKPVFKERNEARKTLAEKIDRPIDNEKLWIGSIAELHKNKGLDYGMEAMENMPNSLYIIIGGGEDKEKLRKLIEEDGLGEKVFLAGQIENAASLLWAFDIFLLPSLKEGLPYALLEAGFAGLPAVATNVGGVREVIDDMKSGIVIKAKRSQEIAAALSFLIDHPKKRKEFGAALAKAVSEKFTLERMVKEMIAVYD